MCIRDRATGAAAYHFGNKIDMVEALKEVPADALAMGNLDPVSLFKAATPEESTMVCAASSAFLLFIIPLQHLHLLQLHETSPKGSHLLPAMVPE